MRLFAAHIMHYYFMDFGLVLCLVLNRVIVALEPWCEIHDQTERLTTGTIAPIRKGKLARR
jgi:hypothetical protein